MNYHKKNNKNGFGVPEGYFDTLEDRIMEAVSRNGKIPEQDGFEVPSGYMDRTEDKIMSAIKGKDKPVRRKEVPAYTLRDIAYTISAVAAAVVILITVFQVDFSSPEHHTVNNSMANIHPEEIEFYIENNMLPLHPQDITEMLDTTDLNAISFSDIEDEELIAYLEENLTDYSDLNFDD